MRDTERLYYAIDDYFKARTAARDNYLAKVSAIRDAKGSKYYADREREAALARETAVTAAQAEARSTVDYCLARMEKSACNVKAKAPTTDQLNLLQVMKLREKPTQNDFDTVANSLDGNGLALAALDEMAASAGLIGGYTRLATDSLTIDGALECIRSVADACASIINNKSGADPVRLMTATNHARVFGGEVHEDDLPQARAYTGVNDFYGHVVPVEYSVFSDAVDNAPNYGSPL